MIEKLRHEQEKNYESIHSWNWRDLMDGDEEVIKIFSKKSKPLIIFNLIIIIIFLPPLFILILVGDFSQKTGLLVALLAVVYSSSGIINVNSKLVITNKSLIIKGVFLSRKVYFDKIGLNDFLLKSRRISIRISGPTRCFFKIRYKNKEYQYPTWPSCGFPCKLGRKEHEEIIKYIRKVKE